MQLRALEAQHASDESNDRNGIEHSDERFDLYKTSLRTRAETVLKRFLKVSSMKILNGKLVRLTFKMMS